MLFLISILSFSTVTLLTLGIAMKGERAILVKRIENLRLLMDQDIETVAPELVQPFSIRVLKPWLARIANAFTRRMPANALAAIDAKLEQAGSPWRLKAAEYVGLKVLAAVVFIGCGIAFFVLSDMVFIYKLLGLLAVGVIGISLPDSLLMQSIRERQRMIRRSLADCLDLLVVCTEAGLGFDQAVAKVAERIRGPLAYEFRRVLQDMSVGRSRADALRAMAKRADLPELTAFVAAIHQADQLGVSIAHVLRVQADSMRSQRNLRAREAAAKLPVKMLFPLVFCIFPAIFVVILGPGAIQIFRALGHIGN